MLDAVLSAVLRRLGGTPCFRIYGKAIPERAFREIEVFASARRDLSSRWPLLRGTCTTFTPEIIVIGWDHAAAILAEQLQQPASPEKPLRVYGGRLTDAARRQAAGGLCPRRISEILAHECGHTWQARRMRSGLIYLPVVGSVTLFGEGRHFWNHFENQASELGLFGGLVKGSVRAELLSRLQVPTAGSLKQVETDSPER